MLRFRCLLKDFLMRKDGLDEEWERKQAIKNVSSVLFFFFKQLKGELDPVLINNNNDNKY